jgi:hypothetical protein
MSNDERERAIDAYNAKRTLFNHFGILVRRDAYSDTLLNVYWRTHWMLAIDFHLRNARLMFNSPRTGKRVIVGRDLPDITRFAEGGFVIYSTPQKPNWLYNEFITQKEREFFKNDALPKPYTLTEEEAIDIQNQLESEQSHDEESQ